jgi:hypothetical protein
MKFRIFNNRGKFMPELCCGKPMWTTSNRETTHYEREYSCWFNSYAFGDKYQLHITPSIHIDLWHKGVLSSIDDLGTVSHSCAIGITFWNWNGSFRFMRVLNTKTTEEINKFLEKAFRHVL